jgi:multiple sugar transport system substrate-binding protein
VVAGIHLERLDGVVGFMAVPRGPDGEPAALIGTMVCGIFRQAAHPELAMRLLRRIVAPEPLAAIGAATGRIPPRRSAVEMARSGLPLLAQTAGMLERAMTRPATPSYPRVSAQLQAMLEAVLTGRLTPARAARRTAEMVGAITGLPVVAGGRA